VASSAPKILLSSLRPQGRRNFTCAHEIGHHIFGHGEQFDELTDEKSTMRKNDPKEFSADCFAAYFLMPKSTIENGMKRRGYAYESMKPIQVYSLASWLGVGYSTLVNHLLYGIGTISRNKAQELQRFRWRGKLI
jgi:Zn-dependent peptidase ImmA (M78 family)